jgi:hypothetical protein
MTWRRRKPVENQCEIGDRIFTNHWAAETPGQKTGKLNQRMVHFRPSYCYKSSCAATAGRTETIRELLARGARLETRNDGGNTALHLAAFYGNAKAVELLLEKGAAVDGRNSDEWTPLMLAAQCGSVATAKILLSHGAQRDAVSAGGCNALGIATDHHCLKMIAFLKQMGAKAAPENAANELPVAWCRAVTAISATTPRRKTPRVLQPNPAIRRDPFSFIVLQTVDVGRRPGRTKNGNEDADRRGQHRPQHNPIFGQDEIVSIFQGQRHRPVSAPIRHPPDAANDHEDRMAGVFLTAAEGLSIFAEMEWAMGITVIEFDSSS